MVHLRLNRQKCEPSYDHMATDFYGKDVLGQRSDLNNYQACEPVALDSLEFGGFRV